MSKNAARTSSKTNLRNELPRKSTKSQAASGTGATTKDRKPMVKQPESGEGDRALKKPTKTVATTSTSRKPAVPSNASRIKNRDPAQPAKRTTPSPSTLPAGKQQPQPVKSKPKSKPNAVLDTYHSVTVASPPQKRRVQPKSSTETSPEPERAPPPPRTRTFTRTLDPDEVKVLKRESAKQRSEIEVGSLPVKQPVAFEVKFEEPKKADNESDNYSDDFESYESDFETGSSTPEEEADDDDDDDDVDDDGDEEESEEPEEKKEQPMSEPDVVEEEEEEDSEPTQNPITVIHRDKEQDRKLDSGHYDMHMRRNPMLAELSSQSTQHQCDSFDTNSMANSEQLDSGISTTGLGLEKTPSGESASNVYYGGYANFVSHPVECRRGKELMRKLRFDHLNYRLFEMKPLSYEGYMQSYGKLNTCQLATQTQSPYIDAECQTLELHSRSSWTQHPPHYGGQMVLSCSGDAESETMLKRPTDDYETSLSRLEQLHRLEQDRTQQQQRLRLAKPTDFERLGTFLHKASRLMVKVLNENVQHRPNSPHHLPLQTGLLNALPVRRIFGSSGNGQLVVTVHECPPQSNVYSEDFANLLMVWSLNSPAKPLRLLSTWAEVCRVAFCSEAPDIVVAGLRDGSAAMWDLRETYSYCSKLDGHLTHFAATQSVVPSLGQATALDLGAMVDVRSFRSQPKTMAEGLHATHKEIQYASLNDSGLLTMWTLVEGATAAGSSASNEYSSPWARVKLLQSASCDLRGYLERRLLRSNQSAYEKTKSLFQGNIYNDDLLRELNETQTLSTALQGQGLQGLRFTSIDTGSDLIYVCSNRNFVLCCTRSLKTERFSRIAVNESRFLFPTSLCVLSNESFVAVGLSNGSVMILNCNQRQNQRQSHKRPTTGMPPSTADHDPDIGKSCAIQNIILNERRSFEQQMDGAQLEGRSYDLRPDTALELIRQPRRSYEMRIFDQQLLLSGSGLRQHLVQALVLSNDGWRLSALANGSVRTYDFYLDKELPQEQSGDSRSHIMDIAAARSSGNEQHLLILDKGGQVQMHSLDS
ncbi:WD repeat-containing protein 60 isoform X1 [Drosophila pseudoobscura]|uniref:WD repeat-containing protein 60 isoform X1 n=1 Tax=Drosophila pseudoobscura pseudoobscura TaxID=46245 RepID=A0A6I8UUM6_DROPS|nr:WD repeat-containing protein 60 isoform X1 [Drosophila pseudoobscura]